MNFAQARKKVTEFVCSDCVLQFNCSNPDKRMDFSALRPCRYKRKLPRKRNARQEGTGI